MYPAPPVNYTFNHPLRINLSQINGILPKQNPVQQVNNKEKQISSTSKDNSKRKNVTNSTTKTEKSSKKPKSSTTRFSNQNRLISQQSNLSTKRASPLLLSRSLGTLCDRIQKERRSHTMAPLTRISGPSCTLQTKLFASIPAPTDHPTNKSNHLTPQFSQVSYPKSDIEITDDDTPIIVKVRYDPQTAVRPSEDAIRKAINKRLFDKKIKKEPIIMNFFEQNIPPQISQNSFPPRIALQPSRTFPFMSYPLIHNRNITPVQAPKPIINQSLRASRLPNRNMNSVWTNGIHPTGINTSKPISHRMASQQSSTTINTQQTRSQRTTTAHSSTEVFRPPAVKDIPELSRENLLSMLNQIPDLQGRQFNIEYAQSSAPEGYPIPSHIDPANNTYPEPVVIDRLPTNVIQHVKSSNNPALTAALEATIQREQRIQSSTLNVQPPTVVHHAAQPYQQVQQSRPVSSNASDSSTEVSSSGTSSSEETDSEQLENIPPAKPANNIPFVGPIPATSH